MSYKVAIRCDASMLMGSGHVMRCLTFANLLHEKGAEITFICRKHPGHLFDMIAASSHQLIVLPPPVSPTGGKLAHAKWLGVTQEEDAYQTAEALNILGHLDWLIVDHYALDLEWEMAMRTYARRIMVIDDLADRKHDCDLLLDQNLHCDMETRYKKLVPLSCKTLLGPKYALLRPEFKEARSVLKMRDGNVKRIFVFFGGSDPTNETGKALRAIRQLDIADIAIDVVVGVTNPHYEDIANICSALPEAKLHCQVSNMAALIARADIAIGAGGSTTWERCALSLPTLTISVAENQVSIAEGVDQANAQIYLGTTNKVTSEIIAVQLERLQQNPQELIAMSESGQRLVDANGSHRIIEAIKQSSLKIAILCSDTKHPIFPLLQDWTEKHIAGYESQLVQYKAELLGGDILFLISCHEIIGKDIRELYKATLVIHASDLPQGRGWSPHIWQIVEGKNQIPVTLLEAEDEIDSGAIWKQNLLSFEGHETYEEINQALFMAELELIDFAVSNLHDVMPRQQDQREPTYYKKRAPEDSKLDPYRSIAEQFDLIRVADSKRFPTFFDFRGQRYTLSIAKVANNEQN